MKLFLAEVLIIVSAPLASGSKLRTCNATKIKPLEGQAIKKLLQLAGVSDPSSFVQIINSGFTIGANPELLPEATDAAYSSVPAKDGKSGDTDFPFGKMKALATVGEYDVCTGDNIVGVPDGLGAYLFDDETVRVVVQSESYGPLVYESRPYYVNGGSASYTGSHVQYVDYDRLRLSKLMESNATAAKAFKQSGSVIETSYNLRGQLVGKRNATGPTKMGAHDSNVDIDGNYVVALTPSKADWIMQSLCSAHLEHRHQWGPGIGMEDTSFVTNEEWFRYTNNANVIGLPAHVVDLKTKTAYAIGAFSLGGFEKIVELNPQHKDYVIFSLAGYNGEFGNPFPLTAKNAMGKRDDGSNYIWTENVHPARIYVGVKGKMEDGSQAPATDFLARNGLRYGQIYGFATELATHRDTFHINATNGAKVTGKWLKGQWRWNGTVLPFIYDSSWDYQNQPVNYFGTNYTFWNARGKNLKGFKCEHNTPDPRPNLTGFAQGSTMGYFGHYYVEDVKAILNAANGNLPAEFPASYYVYQGFKNVTSQIELGGKGMTANGLSAKVNQAGGPFSEFRAVDGLEIISSKEGLRLVIQEDSGNAFGERSFLTSVLEHADDGKELTYYFIGQSGGSRNTRSGVARVGIPAGSNIGGQAHEFSGVYDLSGLLASNRHRNWVVSAADAGYKKRAADASISTNDKYLLFGLQSHDQTAGVIKLFGADRGGQWLLFKPNLPA